MTNFASEFIRSNHIRCFNLNRNLAERSGLPIIEKFLLVVNGIYKVDQYKRETVVDYITCTMCGSLCEFIMQMFGQHSSCNGMNRIP